MKVFTLMKKDLLLDTGATLTLIKVGNLKGETLIWEKPIAFIDVTGHQVDNRKSKSNGTFRRQGNTTYHACRERLFSYEEILGMDFLQKHKIKSDQKNYLQIDGISLKLHPYRKITLTLRNETIVRAVTDKNHVGIVKSEKTRLEIFVGYCLVASDDYTCPISMLNIILRKKTLK